MVIYKENKKMLLILIFILFHFNTLSFGYHKKHFNIN